MCNLKCQGGEYLKLETLTGQRVESKNNINIKLNVNY